MDGNQPTDSRQELPPVQPGQTIVPGQAPVAQAAPVSTPAPTPPAPTYAAPPQPAESLPQAEIPQPVEGYATQAYPQLEDYSQFNEPFPAAASSGPVSWTASEFIAHEKSSNWYVVLFGGAVVAAGLCWLIFKDLLSSIVILVAVGILAAYSKRQPRELQYTLDDSGIDIGEKHYAYTQFRSFSVIEDGAFSSIELMPLKRFAPPISVYYDPANEEAIAQALTPHLPFQPKQPDPIDKFIRRIRF